MITEGAIPFVAADPIRMIVSCVVGSGLAGALSMLYILSILIGSIVSALMMGIWKKKIQ